MDDSVEDKVIQFPLDEERIVFLAEKFEDHYSQTGEFLANGKMAYVERMCAEIFIMAIGLMEERGIDVMDVSVQKDLRFVIDCMKSTLLRYVGVEHPLQKLMDEMVGLKP